MKSTQITVIRHGETVWNAEGRCQGQLDSNLTELGIAQAKAAADRITPKECDVLYSSDLGRAYHTAQLLIKHIQQPIITDSQLRERNFGIYQGLTQLQFQADFPDDYQSHKTAHPDYIIPQGESTRQFFQRVITCFEEIVQKHQGKNIVVVTHGGVLNNLLRHVLSIPLEMPRRFRTWNASINRFSYTNDCWMLETWGDVSHLHNKEGNLTVTHVGV